MFYLAHNYLTRGFWGDEAWTSLISQLPYLQMLKTTAGDFHPPGYYTIVGLLYKFLPATEVNTRLISIAFYLLSLLMIYKLARYVLGHRIATATVLVVGLNPIIFKYAFEARNYTMFAFAATGSIFYLIELSKKFTKPRAVFFAAFSLLGIYTHYYMFFVLAAEFLYIVLFDRGIFIRVLGLYIVDAIFYLPWLRALVSQLTSVNGSYWISPNDWRRTHFEALLRILGGEQQSISRDLLFGLAIVLLVVGIIQHAMRHKFEKPYLLIWLWAVVPFILATLPGLRVGIFKVPFRPIFFWRYLIGSSIPLSMVMVYSAQKLPRQLGALCIILIIALSGIIDLGTFKSEPYSFREAYRQEIVGKITASDKIVTNLPSFAEVLYYRNQNKISNDLIVSSEGLVQSSGKSLLDTYSQNKVVTVSNNVVGDHFEAVRSNSGDIQINRK